MIHDMLISWFHLPLLPGGKCYIFAIILIMLGDINYHTYTSEAKHYLTFKTGTFNGASKKTENGDHPHSNISQHLVNFQVTDDFKHLFESDLTRFLSTYCKIRESELATLFLFYLSTKYGANKYLNKHFQFFF